MPIQFPFDAYDDAGEVRYWSDALGVTVRSIHTVYRTDFVVVYRLLLLENRDDKASVIVKCFLNRDESTVDRLLHIEDFVSRHEPVRSPRVIQSGSISTVYWLTYEDVGLQLLPWSAYRTKRAVQELARIHGSWFERLELPQGLKSHTPPVHAIREDLLSFGTDRFRHMLCIRGLGFSARGRLFSMFEAAVQTEWAVRHLGGAVLCHGDSHLGNILWQTGRRSPTWIDWEYLHVDSPYFDLFQLLDATSPLTPFVRYTSRTEALHAYIDKMRPKLSSRERDAWVRGYLKYASIHLIWILARIDIDLSAGRFERSSLNRQFYETVVGLLSAHRQLVR